MASGIVLILCVLAFICVSSCFPTPEKYVKIAKADTEAKSDSKADHGMAYSSSNTKGSAVFITKHRRSAPNLEIAIADTKADSESKAVKGMAASSSSTKGSAAFVSKHHRRSVRSPAGVDIAITGTVADSNSNAEKGVASSTSLSKGSAAFVVKKGNYPHKEDHKKHDDHKDHGHDDHKDHGHDDHKDHGHDDHKEHGHDDHKHHDVKDVQDHKEVHQDKDFVDDFLVEIHPDEFASQFPKDHQHEKKPSEPVKFDKYESEEDHRRKGDDYEPLIDLSSLKKKIMHMIEETL